jgi:membrane protein insertase Oxa1/YidC/SpoIIIJ
MSVLSFLDHLLLRPLLLIYEGLFNALVGATHDFGAAILLFSLLVNFALLPAYFQMERAGRMAATKSREVERQVARLKAHFKGRELYYYIRTTYRHYGYHPISSVLGAADLYIQVLVFATVYRFLASHPGLAGASFTLIRDLSQPDGLLAGAHLLPIVMTLLNVLSALAYVDEKKKRYQALALALVFLVLLYKSPSGLVLYWTANNFISLIRNASVRFVGPRLSEKLTRYWHQGLTLE